MKLCAKAIRIRDQHVTRAHYPAEPTLHQDRTMAVWADADRRQRARILSAHVTRCPECST